MLERPLVLIVGAGASVDFGFPDGATLAKNIRADLSFEFDFNGQTKGSKSIIQAARAAKLDLNAFTKSAAVIADALPHFKSIDDCLHTHSANELGVLAGKMAIASRIAQAEIISQLEELRSPSRGLAEQRRDEVTKHWVGTLIRMLIAGRPRANFAKVFEGLTVISFNYDRSLETILYNLIQPALDISPAEAEAAMAGLKVLHPYGSLGPLQLSGSGGVPYAPRSFDLMAAARLLFVYTEARETWGDLKDIKDAVYGAERLLFLGFGFHRQNVELLSDPKREHRGKQMFGTVYKEPAAAVERARVWLAEMIGMAGRFSLQSMTCDMYLHENVAALGG